MISTRRFMSLACAAWCGVVAAVPAFADDAADLLGRMNQAFTQLSYDGVFTYYSGDDLTSLRVVHKVVDGVQRERLVHLNGAPREILRHGEEVACIVMPGDDLIALEASIPAGPFARAFVREFSHITDSYDVETMGEGRVAGRSSHRVAVTPRDPHRYGFRLWIDRDTALLLRSELVDVAGARLEIFQFSHVSMGDAVDDAALESSDRQGSMVSHLTLKQAVPGLPGAAPSADTAMDWTVDWLPPGFRMATADIRRKPATDSRVSSLVYSDGLAAFSIFVEAMPQQGAANMVSRNGATVAITRGIKAQQDDYLATLVGEIPEATGHKIIRSVRRR